MTILLTCPICNHETAHEQANLDLSKEITCSVCGFSGLPTAYRLAKTQVNKTWEAAKIVIIILVAIAFIFFGYIILSLIIVAAFYVPVVIAAVVIILFYQRWKQRRT